LFKNDIRDLRMKLYHAKRASLALGKMKQASVAASVDSRVEEIENAATLQADAIGRLTREARHANLDTLSETFTDIHKVPNVKAGLTCLY
jgi:hypothetical protein